MSTKQNQNYLDPRAWARMQPYIAAMEAAQKKMEAAGGRGRYTCVEKLAREIDRLGADNLMQD